MDDADLWQAAQEDPQSEPRADATHAMASAGVLHIVVGYDGSAPASRAFDAAVSLLRGRAGSIHVVWVAHLSSTVMLSAGAIVEMEATFDELSPNFAPRRPSSCAATGRTGSSSGARGSSRIS